MGCAAAARNGTRNCVWVQQWRRYYSSHRLPPINMLVSKQIISCAIRYVRLLSPFDPATAGMLPFGQKGAQKIGFSRCHLTRSLCYHRNEDLSNSSNFRVTVGKVLSRLLFVSVGLCCFPQDGGTYLGERYLVLKVPTEQIQVAAKPESPSTNLCFVFIIWGYVWNTLPGITSQLQGLGMWEIELHSLSPHPPFKKPSGKKPKVIFLLHKSLLIYFPPLVAFQGLLQRKHQLLRSD